MTPYAPPASRTQSMFLVTCTGPKYVVVCRHCRGLTDYHTWLPSTASSACPAVSSQAMSLTGHTPAQRTSERKNGIEQRCQQHKDAGANSQRRPLAAHASMGRRRCALHARQGAEGSLRKSDKACPGHQHWLIAGQGDCPGTTAQHGSTHCYSQKRTSSAQLPQW